jgi:hypothetical protein
MDLDPDTLLSRRKLAEALTKEGYPTAEATLATKATRGGGPPFFKYGPKAIYPWGTSLSWAQSRLRPARSSTSEGDVRRTPVAETLNT